MSCNPQSSIWGVTGMDFCPLCNYEAVVFFLGTNIDIQRFKNFSICFEKFPEAYVSSPLPFLCTIHLRRVLDKWSLPCKFYE